MKGREPNMVDVSKIRTSNSLIFLLLLYCADGRCFFLFCNKGLSEVFDSYDVTFPRRIPEQIGHDLFILLFV